MQHLTPHVAWVTPANHQPARRVELAALDTADCIRRALKGMPVGSSASCRADSRVYAERRTA